MPAYYWARIVLHSLPGKRRGGPEELADELSLTAGSRFCENVLQMCADRRIADAELGADGGKPVPAYDLLRTRVSAGVSPNLAVKPRIRSLCSASGSTARTATAGRSTLKIDSARLAASGKT